MLHVAVYIAAPVVLILAGSAWAVLRTRKQIGAVCSKCGIDNNYLSCADCKLIEPAECKKFNFIIAKIIGFIFNTDRKACIDCIKEKGYEAFVKEMSAVKRMAFKRR